MPDPDLDQIAPLLARWLAPHIARELGFATPDAVSADLSPDYDDRTAAVYVAGLGDDVLPRAAVFFTQLSNTDEGWVLDSLMLAERLGLSTPRNIASVLTNSLKRRAKKLGLPVPWRQSATADNRTSWLGRDDDGSEAYRILQAVSDEIERRGLQASAAI